MEINIRVFECLDAIAKSHGVTDIVWAEAAKIRRPTIPELRRISRELKRGGGKYSARKICTLDKTVRLYSGLRAIIGDVKTSSYLKKCIEGEPDHILRMHFLILLLQHAGQDTRDKAETMLRLLAEKGI